MLKERIESLRPLIDPESIAIVGASSDLTKIGGIPIKSLLDFNYEGRIIPINPKYDEIAGLPCYSHISNVPGEIDLAIIVLPSSLVLNAVKDCGERGVHSLVVISAGFAEVGMSGNRDQEELTRLAKKYNMRILGPNTVGMFNVLSGAMANFSITIELGKLPKGKIGIVSQSGAFSGVMYTHAVQNQIGLNYFIGTGNEADVDIADCIAYMAQDPKTDVIAVYMEGCRDGKKLIEALEAARENKKPVIMLKVGRSEIGRKAALSHTASIVGEDAVYDTIFKQYGAYRVDSIQELLDVAYACSFGRFPQGKNIGIFTISGGAGVMMADYLFSNGLCLPQPEENVKNKLLSIVPFASVHNPIDFTGQLVNDPKLLSKFMKTVLEKVPYDLIVIFTGIQGYKKGPLGNLLEAIDDVCVSYSHIPQLLTTMFTPETKEMIHKTGIPVFNDPIRMTRVVKAMCFFGEHFYGSLYTDEIWKKITNNLTSFSSQALCEDQSKRILCDYSIPVTVEKVAKTEEEAVRFAHEIGYPIVLKGMSPQIVHKTEANLVHLNVKNDVEVVQVFKLIEENIGKVKDAEFQGVLVQEMLKPAAVEMIVGSKIDPLFGPVIMVGMGGIFVEAFKDVSIRKAPVTKNEALNMIQELRGALLLSGLRGRPAVDLDALSDIITALSHLVVDYADEIEEVDINPVMVYPKGQGAIAVDALIKLKSNVAEKV